MRTRPSIAVSAGKIRPSAMAASGIASRGHEELRQAGCKQEDGRVFRPREPGPDGLPHEAGRKQKDRSEREQLWKMAERRKAVDARQRDEIQRERWQVDCQVGYAAAEHTGECSAAFRQRRTGQHRRTDQKGLLQDQHKRRRDDVARIAAHRVEDRLQQNVGRVRARQFRLDEASVRARASRNEIGRQMLRRPWRPRLRST